MSNQEEWEVTMLMVRLLRETTSMPLTPALAQSHEERANALKQKYPDLPPEIVRTLDEHIAGQKATLAARKKRRGQK